MENKISDDSVQILIVDDKKENLLSLQLILKDQGYRFVEAMSGKDALRILLKNQDFAIILMDVQMPLMDGFETAEMIRQSDKLKNVPIIFLTANMNTTDYIFKGYQAGAVDYMIKPLSSEILRAKVMVFVELYRKNHVLRLREEEAQVLNDNLMKANHDLTNQYAEIERFANELKVKNAELDAFAYVSSHDLQEPLRKIQTFTNMILTDGHQVLSEANKYKFEKILYSANRMRALIASLLDFSRNSTAERRFEQVDLNQIIEDLKELFSEHIREKKATIVAEIEGPVNIIPFQFTQLLQNLMANALKFSRPDLPPHITIRNTIISGDQAGHDKLHLSKKYAYISVSDNGIGFHPEHGEKIFGIFQKLHDNNTYEGTGIGLAIVKKIVDNHNGIITATGEPMNGARFDIYLPA